MQLAPLRPGGADVLAPRAGQPPRDQHSAHAPRLRAVPRWGIISLATKVDRTPLSTPRLPQHIKQWVRVSRCVVGVGKGTQLPLSNLLPFSSTLKCAATCAICRYASGASARCCPRQLPSRARGCSPAPRRWWPSCSTARPSCPSRCCCTPPPWAPRWGEIDTISPNTCLRCV
jgi:hypothetical protein